jgi:PDGLE domain
VTPEQPDTPGPTRSRLGRRWWVIGLAIAAVIVVVLAPLASSDPDGLERVAQDHGFLSTARAALYSIIPDYTIPGIGGNLSTILAGLIGVALVFGLMVLLGRFLTRPRE